MCTPQFNKLQRTPPLTRFRRHSAFMSIVTDSGDGRYAAASPAVDEVSSLRHDACQTFGPLPVLRTSLEARSFTGRRRAAACPPPPPTAHCRPVPPSATPLTPIAATLLIIAAHCRPYPPTAAHCRRLLPLRSQIHWSRT